MPQDADRRGEDLRIYSLKAAEKNGLKGISQLPFSMKVLLENLLRHEDGHTVTKDDIKAVAAWLTIEARKDREIAFRPARVLMQDFTGVPAVVDLAAMRDAMKTLGGDPEKINPLVAGRSGHRPFGRWSTISARRIPSRRMSRIEYERNKERYALPALGPAGLRQFPRRAARHRHLPSGQSGISRPDGVDAQRQGRDGKTVEIAFPDTVVGTDSHTTMINGLAVLGWGVGGIEAEAAMLGQPISMLIPEVDRLQAAPASCAKASPPPIWC